MDAISGLFLNALGTDMTAMEEYFPFVAAAYEVLQYAAWALLFLITIWQLFKAFGGPITEAENPWVLIARSSLFGVLILYAKPIFEIALDFARAPYTELMDLTMSASSFTFAGIEATMNNGLVTLGIYISVVGVILMLILMISLGWNYFKLLLEAVERYVVVGILCYTSPLAFAMGGSKSTQKVFQSWCRMVGSQLLLLVMNVWFLRAFNSSVGTFVTNGGALTSGQGSMFLWMFCALAFLKAAQRFDSHLSSLGLSVAQTGGGMGAELMFAARTLSGFTGGAKSAGNIFKGAVGAGGAATGAAAGGMMAGFVSKFKPNSFVRDAVTEGGANLGAGGGVGFVGRMFGSMAAKNGATLTAGSLASVASRPAAMAGSIAGDIADKSIGNFMPHLTPSAIGSLSRFAGGANASAPAIDTPDSTGGTIPKIGQNPLSTAKLSDTQISGGHISTTATLPDGKTANVELFSASQYEKPDAPHSVVSASDGSRWYQMASGDGMGAFYQPPGFTGEAGEVIPASSVFPNAAEGTSLRSVDDGVLEAHNPDGSSNLLLNSAHYTEPDAPHDFVSDANGVGWYSMQPHAETPEFEQGEQAGNYNQSQFNQFMPGFKQEVSNIDTSKHQDGIIEARHADGSATAFYDKTLFQSPRGDYQVYEDARGGQWYAIQGTPAVERKPIYQDGKPIYENGKLQTENVETVKYKSSPTKFTEPIKRETRDIKPPKQKRK